MDSSPIRQLVGLVAHDEIHVGLWLVGVFEDWGTMSAHEADEWRRRILARQRFLALEYDGPREDIPTH